MTSLYIQDRKAYAKCYFSYSYIIQLHYSSIHRMGFADIYIYLLKEKKTFSWEKQFCLYFIWIEITLLLLL